MCGDTIWLILSFKYSHLPCNMGRTNYLNWSRGRSLGATCKHLEKLDCISNPSNQFISPVLEQSETSELYRVNGIEKNIRKPQSRKRAQTGQGYKTIYLVTYVWIHIDMTHTVQCNTCNTSFPTKVGLAQETSCKKIVSDMEGKLSREMLKY